MNEKRIRFAFKKLLAYTTGIYKNGENLLNNPFNIKKLLDTLVRNYKYNKKDIIIVTGGFGVGKSRFSHILSSYDPFYRVIEICSTPEAIPRIFKENLTIIRIGKGEE